MHWSRPETLLLVVSVLALSGPAWGQAPADSLSASIAGSGDVRVLSVSGPIGNASGAFLASSTAHSSRAKSPR